MMILQYLPVYTQTRGSLKAIAVRILLLFLILFLGGCEKTLLEAEENQPPVAVADAVHTVTNKQTVVDLINNDTDDAKNVFLPKYGLDPTTLRLIDIPPELTIVDNGDGTISLTASTDGTYTFQYAISDIGDPVQESLPATVTVNVDEPDVIVITQASYKSVADRWDVRGTIDTPDETVTLTLLGTGLQFATAKADSLGQFIFDVRNLMILPDTILGDQIRVSSENGSADAVVTMLP